MYLYKILDVFGYFIYPLGALSLISSYLIIERLLYLLTLDKAESSIDLEILKKILNNNQDLDKQVRDELISLEMINLKSNYQKGLKLLRFIALISPMVGLLGTIFGMIESFSVISISLNPVSPSMIASGMKLALYTTAYGIIISITSLLFAYIIDKISNNRLIIISNILNKISLQYSGIKYDNL